MEPPRTLFLADAGAKVGGGHIMRCLDNRTLAPQVVVERGVDLLRLQAKQDVDTGRLDVGVDNSQPQPGAGEERGRKLIRDLVATLKPVVIDGHLVVARSVGAGEYWVALNNYTGLTINMMLSGAPTDFWALDPVGLAFGSIGVNSQAPPPKAAPAATSAPSQT